MFIGLLGPVELSQDGEPVVLQGSKLRTMLAALLLAEGKPVHDDRLARFLWGDRPPVTMRAQMYTYASRLRARLGEQVPVRRRHPGYLADLSEVELDVDRFRRLATQGHALLEEGDTDRAQDVLAQALLLWRGPALMDCTDHLKGVVAPPLDALRLTVVEDRAEAMLLQGDYRHLTLELPRLVAEHPECERLQALLMIALYRRDRQSEALRLYHFWRHDLAQRLGINPGDYLTSAYLSVLRGHEFNPAEYRDRALPDTLRV